MEQTLQRLAKRDNVPQATKAVYLLQLALEIDEDDVLNEIASKRDTKDAEFVDHETAWQ